MLLLPQRLERTFEFVDAVAKGERLGVLLSGPEGVGKSAIGLLSYLVCAARGFPVVYIPSPETWIAAARTPDGGCAYLLERFWLQNADLVLQSPALRSIFVAVLLDEPLSFTPSVFDTLRNAVGTSQLRSLGVIFDEVQHIVSIVAARASPSAPPSDREAGGYFQFNWRSWANYNLAFQRMDIGNEKTERNLADGERRRLRLVDPIDPEDNDALARACSPAFVAMR